jgi:hypothetical protein
MATTKKSPLERVKEEHGDKEKLVDRLIGLLSFDGDKDAMKARLLAVSNKKLLRMLEVAGEIKEKFGSPDKLVEAVAGALGRAKDKAYVAKLAETAKRSPAKVLDLLHNAQKKASRSAQA